MAYALPAAMYISSVKYAAVSAWAASHSYAAGALVRQLATPTGSSDRVFACVVAGTSGVTEPTWTVTRGAKTTDSTVTWIEVTGWPGLCGDVTSGNQPIYTLSQTPALGQIIYDSGTASIQVCTTSGAGKTSGAPTWSATAGVTATDASATWTSLGLASGFGVYAAPYSRFANAMANANNGFPSPTNVYVDKNHAETQSTSISTNAPSTARFNVISVDPGACPPTTYTTGASLNTTSSGVISIGSATTTSEVLLAGIVFNSNSSMSFGAGENSQTVFQDCAFNSINSGSTSSPTFTGPNGGSRVFLKNCSFNFTQGSQGVTFNSVNVVWKGGSITGVANNPISTSSFTGILSILQIEGVDFSGGPSGAQILNVGGEGSATFKDCKLASGQSLTNSSKIMVVDGVNVDSGATQYQMQRTQASGTITTQTVVTRTGGASMGGQAVGHFYSMAAGNNAAPAQGIPVAEWNPNTAANVTVTQYGIAFQTAMPKTGDIYLHITYPGSASSPLSSIVETTSITPLAPAGVSQTADTSAWDSGVTARANSTNYSVISPLTLIKTASASGMVFYLTGAGVSAASEPGAYATAVDGQSITDGTCTFRAGWRFKMVGVLSSPQPQIAGYIWATPLVPGTVTLYLDPTIVLS